MKKKESLQHFKLHHKEPEGQQARKKNPIDTTTNSN